MSLNNFLSQNSDWIQWWRKWMWNCMKRFSRIYGIIMWLAHSVLHTKFKLRSPSPSVKGLPSHRRNGYQSKSCQGLGGCETLQAMTNDSDLNMENNIRKRDTQFISMFWLNTLENQMKCQSNVFDTVFTNNICSYLLCVVADNMEQCRYNILAQNISKGFQ